MSKFEEMHADLLGSHNPLSQLGNLYAAIFIYKHSQKTWIFYL